MQEKYTNAFLAAGPEEKNFALELTYNYGKDSYNIGSGFGHFALRVEDVYKTVDSIKAAGVFGMPYLHITILGPSCAVLRLFALCMGAVYLSTKPWRAYRL